MREASQVAGFSAQDVRLVSVKLCCEDKPKLSLEDSWGCCTILSAARRVEGGLTRGRMSGLSRFQTPRWCGVGVMITRRKHGALNGITQGGVNLRRAGGELNMI